MQHRSDIEGLRAVAVLAVLLFHFGVPGIDGGYVGVDVFFVISGFLITALLLREKESTGTICLRDFYARRVRRLLPLSATVLVSSSVAGLVWLSPARLDEFAEDLVAAALFFPNMLFAGRGADYLQSQLPESPLQHFWSLAVEEQFYVLWPVLILLVTRGRVSARPRVLTLISVVIAVSLYFSVTLTASHPSWSYFGLHTRAWELAVGALIAVAWPKVQSSGLMRPWLGWVGMGAVVWSVLMFDGATSFPGHMALIPVLGTALVIVNVPPDARRSTWVSMHRILSVRPLQMIGARSYGLYLWHWPALIISEAAAGEELSASQLTLVAVGVLVVNEVTHHFIENPARRSGLFIQHSQLTVNLGASLVLIGVLAGGGAAWLQPNQSTGVVVTTPTLAPVATTIAPVETTAAPSGPKPIRMGSDPAPQAVIDGLGVQVAPDNLDPPTSRAESDTNITYDNDCHQFFKETVKTDCIFGDPNGTVTIALFGDSHAAQWFTPLNDIAIAQGWRLLALTQGGCTPIEISVFNVQNNGVYRHCTPWRKAAIEYMVQQGVDVVFTGQYVRYRDADTGGIVGSRKWRIGYTDLTRTLRSSGIEPVFFVDTPDIPGVPPDCIAANRRNIPACNATLSRSTLVDVVDALRGVAREEKVSLIDPQRWLCHENQCPVIVGNISVYRDDNHISDVMARWLQPLLAEKVVPFVTSFVTTRVGS